MALDQFESFIGKLQAFDFAKEMDDAITANEDVIPDLVAQQLAIGKDGKNEDVTLFGKDEYAPFTIELKEKYGIGLGAVTNRITNYMTGAFYRGLKTEKSGGTFETTSDVEYFGKIQERSGTAITELNEEHERDFAEQYTLPAIATSLKEKTGLIIT